MTRFARARWLVPAFALAAALAVVSRAAFRPGRFAIPSPGADTNILVVTIDTLRAGALGAYGGRAATPNLDRLAAQGARFTFAHTHSLLTLPSHATLFTGRYPYEHGVRDNHGYRLAPGRGTMAARLKARGFATGAFVGAFPLERRFGLNDGFDVYDDRFGETDAASGFDETQRRADAVVTAADAWIGAQTGRWFAWVHVYDPHAPYLPPPDWRARYPDDAYAAEVAWTDAALGPLFDRVRAAARPTFVVVTSDHGEALGDHGELTHGVFAYESTLRVPLIVATIDRGRAPDRPGVVVDAPVRLVDLLPSVLDVAGAPDASLPGASLRDVIARGTGPDRPAYFETFMTNLARGWAPLRGVIAGREKYIDLPIAELYDLADDPREQVNRAGDRGDRVAALRHVLETFSVAPIEQPRVERGDVEARLRSLGYAGTVAPSRERYTEDDDPKRLIALDRRMQQAVQAAAAGRVDDAAGMLRAVIDARPDNAEAYLDLAVVYWDADRRQDAIDVLRSALDRGLTQPDLRVKLGLCLALSGEGARAIPLLAPIDAPDVETLNALGLSYAQAGRAADALRTYQRALDVDPVSGLTHENIAAVHVAQRAFAAAERELRRAIDLDPALTGARTQLGGVLAANGRGAEAIAEWTRAVERDPQAWDAMYDAAIALADAGRAVEARPYAERFVQSAPRPKFDAQIAHLRALLAR